MAADFIPSNHNEFLTKFGVFQTWLAANGAAFGFTAAEVAAIGTAKTDVQTKLAARTTADNAAQAAMESLRLSEDSAADLWRAAARRLQAAPAMTDAIRVAAGLTVTSSSTPVGPPATAPVGRIELLNRFEHVIHFVDSANTSSKAKPPGVRGCQVWVKVGTTPPASPSELHFLATDTRTPYVAQFEVADSGKTAYYWLRWENTKGETGPWSAPISATITG